MTNLSWGTKRNCPGCGAHFYDLNKMPAVCPKCAHQFDPTVVARVKRKSVKRNAEEKKTDITPDVLAAKKAMAPKKKDKRLDDDDGAGEGIGDIAEIEDVDDIENLQELSELEEIEETSPATDDDSDDEAIIEDLDTGGKTLVENIEDEEARALIGELEDEAQESAKKPKPKKKK